VTINKVSKTSLHPACGLEGSFIKKQAENFSGNMTNAPPTHLNGLATTGETLLCFVTDLQPKHQRSCKDVQSFSIQRMIGIK
jgi:hypothetical protein